MYSSRAEIRNQILQEAIAMVKDVHLDTISEAEFKKLLNNDVFEHISCSVNKEFSDNDYSDSGENARIDDEICFVIAKYINDNNLDSKKYVKYHAKGFIFTLEAKY